MTEHQFKMILQRIKYKEGYELVHQLVGTGITKVWWHFYRPDMRTGEGDYGDSGPILINWGHPGTTEEGVVRSVFGMTLRLEEHESREFFMYQDNRPFDPHVKLIDEGDTE